jgi:hypothetical protein
MRSILLATSLMLLVSSRAFGLAIVPDPPNPDAAAIAGLVNQFLVASQDATTQGNWLDASVAGDASNRGQSLIVPTPPVLGPGTVTLNGFNGNVTTTVHFDDGAGSSGTVGALAAQFTVAYVGSGGGTVDFNTFCIDLFHTVLVGQTYDADARGDVASAFVNGARMAFIFETYGAGDLSSNPIMAAAVQIALWDLSLGNHNPQFFAKDPSGTYSSGDPDIFSINFDVKAVPEPATGRILLAGVILLALRRRTAGWLRHRPPTAMLSSKRARINPPLVAAAVGQRGQPPVGIS